MPTSQLIFFLLDLLSNDKKSTKMIYMDRRSAGAAS